MSIPVAGCGGPTSPTAAVSGPSEAVYHWNSQACETSDYPDLPVRAFRDARGDVRMTVAHLSIRWLSGPDFDHLEHACGASLRSERDPSPGHFRDRELVAATFTGDGRKVEALVHDEYQGHRHPGRCRSGSYLRCWYNAITLARSSDGGRTFERVEPGVPVAAPAHRYRPDAGLVGVLEPSNVAFNRRDRRYYTLAHVRRSGPQRSGVCVLRTRTPDRPRSWRAWGGQRFDRRMASPYSRERRPLRERLCAPVSPHQIPDMSNSLTYNTYFHRFLLVGRSGDWDPRRRRMVWGFYFSLSKDLLHWSRRRLIMETQFPERYRCGDRDPYLYPSIVDRRSKSRNFATSGRRVELYFTRLNYEHCRQTDNRDLLRVPIEFGGRAP